MEAFNIIHHGAVTGVTGSCHELRLASGDGILVDCGLFQGAEVSESGADAKNLQIDFPISHVKALIVTHVHIDHVGRIPYLLAAGFKGPILCSSPSAMLLPLVLEDALKVGVTRNKALIDKTVSLIRKRIIALPYNFWFDLPLSSKSNKTSVTESVRARLQPAGHILGSAYVELELAAAKQNLSKSHRVVFSGDLGAAHTPILPAPKSPYRCNTLIIESTYGNRLHENRRTRQARLKTVLERCLKDNGVVLVPAFSIGRTQELLYELESIITAEQAVNERRTRSQISNRGKHSIKWNRLAIIVDSPLANRFTKTYRQLKPYWDAEALSLLQHGRDPLDFDQLVTVGSHRDHERLVRRLQNFEQPCIVIAASGMCAGGRIVNYLKALVGSTRTDVVFVGYQAKGTPGREILDQGGNGSPKVVVGNEARMVTLDRKEYVVRAGVHWLGGYSAHADQVGLVNFVKRMRVKPEEIRIVHGEAESKRGLRAKLKAVVPQAKVVIPG